MSYPEHLYLSKPVVFLVKLAAPKKKFPYAKYYHLPTVNSHKFIS